MPSGLLEPSIGDGLSTIAPKWEPIVSLIVPILANITSPSKGPLRDGQVVNVASTSKLRGPQDSPPLNAIEALRTELRSLRLDEPVSSKQE